MKVVEIHWIDAYSDDGMLALADAMDTPKMILVDIGYLVSEDADYYHLVREVMPNKKDWYRWYFSIPKVCVKQFKVLRK